MPLGQSVEQPLQARHKIECVSDRWVAKSWDADQRVLEKAGAAVVKVAGCCGLAGNFGVEHGHYEVSVAVAESHLLPAVRSHPDAVYLADGMSCRVQLDDLAHAPAMHLAELFAARLEPGNSTGPGD